MQTEKGFQHFVLTLFNLKIWAKDKNDSQTHTSQWLDSRFDLFEKYCLPSMMAQSCKDFKWLVFFDTDTPQSYKQRIKQYESMYRQFTPVFMDAEKAKLFRVDDPVFRCMPFRNTVREFLGNDCKYLITTNLDNDDALSTDAINRIQTSFKEKTQEGAIIFPYGVQYLSSARLMLKMKYPHNHFISLVERADGDFKTTLYHVHTKVRKTMPVTDLDSRPGWLEIVHGSNVSNELRITSRIKYHLYFGSSSLKDFGLNISFSAVHNSLAAIFRYPVYLSRTAVKKMIRKISRKK